MRKVLISLAAAAATLAFASPAAAQYYQPYGYGYGYGQPYGYGQDRDYVGWSAISSLQRRLDNVQRSLAGVRRDQVGRIAGEANALERRLHFAARNGLSRYEAQALNVQIGRLEQRLQWASANRGYGHYYRDRW